MASNGWYPSLLSLCLGIHRSPMDGGIFSQMATNAKLWFFCWPEQDVEQIFKFLVIWDAMTIIWRNCNANTLLKRSHGFVGMDVSLHVRYLYKININNIFIVNLQVILVMIIALHVNLSIWIYVLSESVTCLMICMKGNWDSHSYRLCRLSLVPVSKHQTKKPVYSQHAEYN